MLYPLLNLDKKSLSRLEETIWFEIFTANSRFRILERKGRSEIER